MKRTTWQALTHPDDLGIDTGLALRTRRGEIPHYVMEKRYLRQDGSPVWVKLFGNFAHDQAGEAVLGIAVAIDISEQRRQDMRLRESETRLQLATEAGQIGIYDVDRQTGAVWWDERTRALWGYTANQPLTLEDFWRGLHPDEAPETQAALARATDPAGDGGYAAVYRVRPADGSDERWVRATGRVFFEGEGTARRAVRLVGTVQDISAQQRAYDALRDTTDRLRFALTAAQTGIWEWNVSTDAVIWSPECYAIHGLREGEFDGRAIGFDRLLHPEDREHVWTTVRTAIERRTPYENEFRIRTPAGAVRWVSNRGRMAYDAGGQPLRMLGTITDITARKEAELALRASEQKYRRLLESIRDAFVVVDMAGHIQEHNEAYREMLGYTDAELRQLTYMDLTPPRWHAMEAKLVAEQILPTGSSDVYEKEYRRKDGSVFPVELRTNLMQDDAGRPQQMWAVVRDITARKQVEAALRESEERFRALADNISQFAWMADDKGRIYWYNRRWHDYAGTTLAQMQGSGWTKVVHPDHVARVARHIQEAWDSGEPWEDTFPLRAKDGQYRWFLSRAVPIRNVDGKVVRWFGTNTDITELRQAEATLKEADQRKDEFLATLAHELRNPLGAINYAVGVLNIVGSDNETARRARATISRQMAHTVRFIDDLLDVGRITGGKLVLRNEPLNLADVIDAALDLCRPSLEQAGLELSLSLPPEVVHLQGDKVRLAQAISNLLHNACKFTRKGGRVTLTLQREGTEAVVRVRDTGIGIAMPDMDRVFDMFTQVASPLKGPQQGLGIGLALARGLIAMHGGTIEARSEGPGQGSEFVVRLPAQPALVDIPAVDAPSLPARPVLSPRRILVVDDNADNAETLALLLGLEGHEVETAADGPSALKKAERSKPAIVLLDIGLPGLDGYAVCRAIRSTPWGQDMVIVALTGWGLEEDRRKTEKAGFDAHLVKPVEYHELLQVLQSLQSNRARSTFDSTRKKPTD